MITHPITSDVAQPIALDVASGSSEPIPAQYVPSNPIGAASATLAAYADEAPTAPTFYQVTSLRDTGTGSLREALEASGPRVVTFHPALDGRTIYTETPIEVTNPYLSFIGSDASVVLDSTDRTGEVLFLDAAEIYGLDFRVRPGTRSGTNGSNQDCIRIGANADNIYLKNFSTSFGADECIDAVEGAGRITLENGLVAWPINTAHSGGDHGYGALFDGAGSTDMTITLYRMGFTGCLQRSPGVFGGAGVSTVQETWAVGNEPIGLITSKPQDSNGTQINVVGCLFQGGSTMSATQGVILANGGVDAASEGNFYWSDNQLDDGITKLNTANGTVTESGTVFGGVSGWATDPENLSTTLPAIIGARPLDDLDTNSLSWMQEKRSGRAITAEHVLYAKWAYAHTKDRDTKIVAATLIPTDHIKVEGRFRSGTNASSTALPGVWTGTGNKRSWLARVDTNGKIEFRASADGSTTGFQITTTTTFGDGAWHDFVIDVEPVSGKDSATNLSGTITVDGVVQSLSTDTSSITGFYDTDALMQFGEFSGPGTDFDFAMEDIKITIDDVVVRNYTFNGTLEDSGADEEDATNTGADDAWYELSTADPVIPAASTLVQHYDFSGDLAFNNGTNFTAVASEVGNAHLATVSRPSVTTLNGLTAALFDSVSEDRRVTISNPVTVTDFTIHVVCTIESGTGQKALIGEDGSNRLGYTGSTSAISQFSLRIEADTDSPSFTVPIDFGTATVITFRREGTDLRTYINGVLQTISTCGTDARTFANIGGRSSGGEAFQHLGKIGEVKIHDAALSVDAISAEATGLLSKWEPSETYPTTLLSSDTSSFQLIPQNNCPYFDGTYYWNVFTRGTDLLIGYGDGTKYEVYDPGIADITNNGKTFAATGGEYDGMQYLWVAYQAGTGSSQIITISRWLLTPSGPKTISTITSSTESTTWEQASITAIRSSGVVTKILYSIANVLSLTKHRSIDPDMTNDTAEYGENPSHDFGEISRWFPLDDGYVALFVNAGDSGDDPSNTDDGAAVEFRKSTLGIDWDTEVDVEDGVGMFLDMNYADNSSHTGQCVSTQTDDLVIHVAYVSSEDTTAGDYGRINFLTRGTTQTGTWTNQSTDVAGESVRHVELGTDGTNVYLYWIPGTSSPGSSVKRAIWNGSSFGTPVTIYSAPTGSTVSRMAACDRSSRPLVTIEVYDETSTYELQVVEG